MSKLIYKLLFLICSVFFVGALISMNASYAWGNIWYQAKLEHLENNFIASPTVYFFGSSRIYRQIDPKVFDSVYYLNTNVKTESYNLGAPATFCPQSYYLYERFLESQLQNSARVVFIELTAIDLIPDQQLGQARSTYWQNLSTTAFALRAIQAEKSLKKTQKRKAVHHYVRSYIENAMAHHYAKKMIFGNALVGETLIGADSTGYLSLEQQLKLTTHEITKVDLTKRKNMLENAPKLLEKRSEKVSQAIAREDTFVNTTHLDRIFELIAVSKRKGIHLIFMVPPRVASDQVFTLAREIPKEHLNRFIEPRKISKTI